VTSRILTPLWSATTYRRGLFLLLGGVLALPYALLVAAFAQVWAQRRPWWPVMVLIAVLVAPVAVAPAFLGGTRVLEIAAVRWLLDVELPDPRTRPDREARLRCALWYAVHLVTGAVVGSVLVVAVPVALASAAGRRGVLLPLLAVAALVAVGYAVAGLGSLAAAMAPVLLGPSVAERVAALEAQALVLAQRNRLARELHDSIGHALTVTTLQAAAARQVLERDPAFARRALAAIEDAGRTAAEELDRVLGILREDRPARPAPPRTLDDVDRLVDEARGAGAEVSLRVDGLVGELPAVVSREGYRIIQESLTNALRHAGPVPVTVTVSVRDRLLTIEVDNPSPRDRPAAAGKRPGPGRGLAGMRERIILLGGALHTSGGGRWRLHASLPVQQKP
jgi:signal transduction histidine kinase